MCIYCFVACGVNKIKIISSVLSGLLPNKFGLASISKLKFYTHCVYTIPGLKQWQNCTNKNEVQIFIFDEGEYSNRMKPFIVLKNGMVIGFYIEGTETIVYQEKTVNL